jgi:hypothetical protein
MEANLRDGVCLKTPVPASPIGVALWLFFWVRSRHPIHALASSSYAFANCIAFPRA